MARKKRAKRPVPNSVRTAQQLGDHDALSRLGRLGAERKKEIAAKDREQKEKEEAETNEQKKRRMLFSYYSMARQANEHICPLD